MKKSILYRFCFSIILPISCLSSIFLTSPPYDFATQLPEKPVVAARPPGIEEKSYNRQGSRKYRWLEGLKLLQQHSKQGIYSISNMMLFTKHANYSTADQKCREINSGNSTESNLLTITTRLREKKFKALIEIASYSDSSLSLPSFWVWVGLIKVKNNRGNMRSRVYRPRDWEWTSGKKPFKYRKWLPGQPDQKKRRKMPQNHVVINKEGMWRDTWPYKHHAFACNYHTKYIVSVMRLHWRDAREACRAAGMNLARVQDEGEIEEMIRAIGNFIGTDQDEDNVFSDTNWVLLDGRNAGNQGAWVWDDGEKIGDISGYPWISSVPDTGTPGEEVMSMSKWGQFDNVEIATTQRQFACQYNR